MHEPLMFVTFATKRLTVQGQDLSLFYLVILNVQVTLIYLVMACTFDLHHEFVITPSNVGLLHLELRFDIALLTS